MEKADGARDRVVRPRIAIHRARAALTLAALRSPLRPATDGLNGLELDDLRRCAKDLRAALAAERAERRRLERLGAVEVILLVVLLVLIVTFSLVLVGIGWNRFRGFD